MNSRERVRKAINHEAFDRVPIDLGATHVSGIHVVAMKKLREKLGLENRLPIALDPLLLVAEVEEDVREALGLDCVGIYTKLNSIGLKNENYKEWVLHDGTKILICGGFKYRYSEDGTVYAYPQGDERVEPSARMSSASLYFDCIPRQEDLDAKTEWNARKDYHDQYAMLTDEDLRDIQKQVDYYYKNTQYSLIGNYGNAGLGDAFHIPGPWLKETKGIRDIADWFMGMQLYPDYIKELFEMQTEISLANLKKYYEAAGDKIDVMVISGTDFAHQSGLLLSKDIYRSLFKPYYKTITEWIHSHTGWKTFAHCCGSVSEIIPEFIETGFDILNPVQVSAVNMDAQMLKDKFGKDIVFWGGGCDPQHLMPTGTPEEVYRQTKKNAEVFSQGGGFVGGNVHNVQYDVPVENLLAEISAFKDTVPNPGL